MSLEIPLGPQLESTLQRVFKNSHPCVTVFKYFTQCDFNALAHQVAFEPFTIEFDQLCYETIEGAHHIYYTASESSAYDALWRKLRSFLPSGTCLNNAVLPEARLYVGIVNRNIESNVQFVSKQLGCPLVEVSGVSFGSVELPLLEQQSENNFNIQITEHFENAREFDFELSEYGQPGFYRCSAKTTVQKLEQKKQHKSGRKPKNSGSGLVSRNGLVLIERFEARRVKISHPYPGYIQRKGEKQFKPVWKKVIAPGKYELATEKTTLRSFEHGIYTEKVYEAGTPCRVQFSEAEKCRIRVVMEDGARGWIPFYQTQLKSKGGAVLSLKFGANKVYEHQTTKKVGACEIYTRTNTAVGSECSFNTATNSWTTKSSVSSAAASVCDSEISSISVSSNSMLFKARKSLNIMHNKSMTGEHDYWLKKGDYCFVEKFGHCERGRIAYINSPSEGWVFASERDLKRTTIKPGKYETSFRRVCVFNDDMDEIRTLKKYSVVKVDYEKDGYAHISSPVSGWIDIARANLTNFVEKDAKPSLFITSIPRHLDAGDVAKLLFNTKMFGTKLFVDQNLKIIETKPRRVLDHKTKKYVTVYEDNCAFVNCSFEGGKQAIEKGVVYNRCKWNINWSKNFAPYVNAHETTV
jgi:hypothetical protein